MTGSRMRGSAGALALTAWTVMCTATFAADTLTEEGQPFCREEDNLVEFVTATLSKDVRWMKALDGCILTKAGLKFVTLSEIENDGELPLKVAKVRLFTAGTKTVVGYTLVPKEKAK